MKLFLLGRFDCDGRIAYRWGLAINALQTAGHTVVSGLAVERHEDGDKAKRQQLLRALLDCEGVATMEGVHRDELAQGVLRTAIWLDMPFRAVSHWAPRQVDL